MLFEIMKHLHNFFITSQRYEGRFTIEDGTISLPFVKEGQYFMFDGSEFNTEVMQYPPSGLVDEEFYGEAVILAPPKAFLDLVAEIEDYQANHKADNLQSESFGGYSYTKATGTNGGVAGGQDVFKTRLNTWRKI